MYLKEDLHPRSIIRYEELDRSNSEVLQQRAFHIDKLIRCMDNDWGLVEDTLRLNRTDSAIRVVLSNERLGEDSIHLDELLIRPLETDLYRKEGEMLWWNNRWMD